jgi:hypothetical protein
MASASTEKKQPIAFLAPHSHPAAAAQVQAQTQAPSQLARNMSGLVTMASAGNVLGECLTRKLDEQSREIQRYSRCEALQIICRFNEEQGNRPSEFILEDINRLLTMVKSLFPADATVAKAIKDAQQPLLTTLFALRMPDYLPQKAKKRPLAAMATEAAAATAASAASGESKSKRGRPTKLELCTLAFQLTAKCAPGPGGGHVEFVYEDVNVVKDMHMPIGLVVWNFDARGTIRGLPQLHALPTSRTFVALDSKGFGMMPMSALGETDKARIFVIASDNVRSAIAPWVDINVGKMILLGADKMVASVQIKASSDSSAVEFPTAQLAAQYLSAFNACLGVSRQSKDKEERMDRMKKISITLKSMVSLIV